MEKVNALVLKSIDYKDNDKILTLFSLENGKLTAGIKGVKKAGAKLKFAAQPFCFAEYVLAENGDRYTVTQASLHQSFYELSLDIEKYYVSATILQFALKFLPDAVESPELFHLTINTLKKLAFNDCDNLSELALFLIEALNIAGYAINFHYCVCCEGDIENRVYLSIDEGGCTCNDCHHENDIEFSMYTYQYLKRLAEGENCDNVDREVKIKGLKLLKYYVTGVSGESIEGLNKIINGDF